MRSSLAALLALLMVGCSRQSAPPAFVDLLILPVENLTPAPNNPEAPALQSALWDAFQAQPKLRATRLGHARELSGLGAAVAVNAYVAPGRFHLEAMGHTTNCAGTFADCLPRLTTELGSWLGATPRPLPKAETVLLLTGSATLEGTARAAALEKATQQDPLYAAAWLERSTWLPPAEAAAMLRQSPIEKMTTFDQARIRLRITELSNDPLGRRGAMLELAKQAPADLTLQRQAANEAIAGRQFAVAAARMEQVLAVAPAADIYNELAYIHAHHKQRAKAEEASRNAQRLAPNQPALIDTMGDIEFLFGDYKAAADQFEAAAAIDASFLQGLILWKAAEAARLAGDLPRAEKTFARYLDVRQKSNQPNVNLLQAIWQWRLNQKQKSLEYFRAALNSGERSRALFFLGLVELRDHNPAGMQTFRRQMEAGDAGSVLLQALVDGQAPAGMLQLSPEAIAAVSLYLSGKPKAATARLEEARKQMHPFTEGAWKLFANKLSEEPPLGVPPLSPDDWLAFLLQ